MNKSFSVLALLVGLSCNLVADVGHQAGGTDYSSEGVLAYEKSKHGQDGSFFLDPCFIPKLEKVKNQVLLDAGCGAGPWALYAAKHGATVYGIDIQLNMIERAAAGAKKEGLENSTHFTLGSVAQLPYEEQFFDGAISVNVGCNLPTEVFSAHFRELHRVLKRGGEITITAPASFGVLFTSGHDVGRVRSKINAVLDEIGASNDTAVIVAGLQGLEEVLRATFAFRKGRLVLIDDERDLVEGENIWRKIPGLVVPNFYHSEASYMREIAAAGLCVEKIERRSFSSEEEWRPHAAKLGKEYIHQHAFVVFHLSKR